MDTNEALREAVIEMMNSGTYELKPCPFCGATPTIMSRKFFEGLDEENGSACITVNCPNCSLDFRDHTSNEHNYFVRAFLVSEKWNRRV